MSRDFVNDIFSKGELGIMEYLDNVKARAAADRKKILLDIQAEAIVETMLGTDKLYLYRLNELARRVKEAISANINKEQDEAIKYYEMAISMGVLERTGTGYKRKDKEITKAQLAYFLREIHKPDVTGKDGKAFPETELNNLFGERRLGEAVRKLAENKHGNGKPRGYKKIDEILEKTKSLIHDQQKAPQK
jgi:hypothetical protein